MNTQTKALDISREHPLSLAEAAASLQIGGRRPHVSSLWRWARRGLHGVNLEYARIGKQMVTSREALARFGMRLAELDHDLPPTPIPTSRTTTERDRAIDAAEARLVAAGA